MLKWKGLYISLILMKRDQIKESEIHSEELIWEEKNSYKSLREKEEQEKSLWFLHTYQKVFLRLQLWICSLLDRTDFWPGDSTHVIFQVVRLDHEKDTWRERDKCFVLSVLYFGVLSSCLYCTNWKFILIWLLVACFSILVGCFLVSSLIIVELFFWSRRPMVFTLALRGFPRYTKCVCFLSFLFRALYFIGDPHKFL